MAGGVGVYQYLMMDNDSKKEITTEQEVPNSDVKNQESNPVLELENNGIEIQGGGGGSLTICGDKCGDGICQSTVSDCKEGSPNCVCIESKNDCPQDCK